MECRIPEANVNFCISFAYSCTPVLTQKTIWIFHFALEWLNVFTKNEPTAIVVKLFSCFDWSKLKKSDSVTHFIFAEFCFSYFLSLAPKCHKFPGLFCFLFLSDYSCLSKLFKRTKRNTVTGITFHQKDLSNKYAFLEKTTLFSDSIQHLAFYQ